MAPLLSYAISLGIFYWSPSAVRAFSSQPQRMASFEPPKCPVEGPIPEASPLSEDLKTDIVFIGTGGSSGTPHLHCLLGTRNTGNSLLVGEPCPVCSAALQGDARFNKNYRGNPSLLIRHRHRRRGSEASGGGADDQEEEVVSNVLIDAGKTFREAAQRWFPVYAHGGLDAVLLTHEHADAILGIDDLRGVQRARPLPVFTSRQCFERIEGVFPYLLPASKEGRDPRLFVAALEWRVLENLSLVGGKSASKEQDGTVGRNSRRSSRRSRKERVGVRKTLPRDTSGVGLIKGLENYNESENIPEVTTVAFSPVLGLEVRAFAVEHGPGFMSLGFAFGPNSAKTVYISDVSRVPEAVLRRLCGGMAGNGRGRGDSDEKDGIGGENGDGDSSDVDSSNFDYGDSSDGKTWDVETLIVDCLHPGPETYPTHFSLPQVKYDFFTSQRTQDGKYTSGQSACAKEHF
mmetsp:Transcript_66729/g.134505  ORF Transcript_66729/g.134505 Transcript_66729/m.134505 type:complete len:460 (+) Transcript_66729:189-1568(+)